MPDRGRHCPFLNRSDPRCSNHFSLDRLSDAFDQCVGAYAACPSYRELLVERRIRRGEITGPEAHQLFPGQVPAARDDRSAATATHHHGHPIVPLTLSAAGRGSDAAHPTA